MFNSDEIILSFIKGNGIATSSFFLFMKYWAVAHKKVENNSIFTLVAIALSEVWGIMPFVKKGGSVLDCPTSGKELG